MSDKRVIALYIQTVNGDTGMLPHFRVAAQPRISAQPHWSADRAVVEIVDYVETLCSPTDREWPVLKQLMSDAQLKKFDEVVIMTLDSFGSSMRELLANLTTLGRLGIRLRVIAGIEIDSHTPEGQLAMKLLGELAEFERETRIKPVRARMAEAKRRGKKWGRRPRSFPLEKAAQLRRDGMSWRAIGRHLRVPA